jgi:methionyl-tRNA synthetase
MILFMSGKFYITTSIPYANAKPHIGHLMEFIQADVLARYHRFKGDDVFFLTGTDEHGMKMMTTAKELGTTARELADLNSALFRNTKEQYNVSFDGFVRTTDDAHKRGAQKMWMKLKESGDLYKDSYEGLYCVGCEAFVLGKDLVDGKCVNHNKEPQKLKEENYFFKLSKYGKRIAELIESDKLKIVPESKKHEILEVIKDGLRDVSFSRPKHILEWGIDVPDDPNHVMYVWCDALSNYITAIGYENETAAFKKWWPADVHIIGKDILRFHAAIWIGMLISADLPLPKSICVHGFITSEGKKMSKTLGNVVDPVEYAEKFGVDPLRYYVLKEIPTTDDGDFSKERFNVIYSSELANNIGNLVSRVIAMGGKFFDSKVPKADLKNELLRGKAEETWDEYCEAVEGFDFKKALEIVAGFAFYANKYVDDTKPWVLAKDEKTAELEAAIYNLLEMVRQIGLMLKPFLPATSEKILDWLGVDLKGERFDDLIQWGGLKEGAEFKKAELLFMRVEG